MKSITSEWLVILRSNLESITREAALNHWPGSTPDNPPYFNYRLEHVLQVERDAMRLMESVGGDEEVILASVWIHDRFQPQYMDNNHPAEAEQWAREHLASLGFPEDKVEAVCYCVANHSNPPGAIPEDEEDARILWDADKLSKVGAVSIAAFMCGIPAFPDKIIGFREIAKFGTDTTELYTDLPDSFYFDISRIWAKERLEAQMAFYNDLAREVGLVN
ncbi:MAG: HD domain-containing protein [Anaerolineales bacterium]|nr:HD domain-containing protein [Anaerolineales bacterium]